MRFRGHSPQSSPRTRKEKVSLTSPLFGTAKTVESPPEQQRRRHTSPPHLIAAALTRPAYSWWPTTTATFASDQRRNKSNSFTESSPLTIPIGDTTQQEFDWNSPSSPTSPIFGPYLNSNIIMAGLDSEETKADEESKTTVPKFAFREITLGTLVGHGGFSDVREILTVDLEEVFDTSEEESRLRREFAQQANEKGAARKKFVLKCLRNDLPEEEHTKGVVDLAIEANMLAALRHDNIITLRATANSDPQEGRFFVVLDRLSVTLERKFNLWRKIVGDSSGFYFPCYGYCCSKAHVLHDLWKERLQVALQTASAVEYLHGKGIVFRDLKPDNIGFDAETSMVKLFDFGLSKKLSDAEKAPGGNGHPAYAGLYHLTGNTGSLRYMAPEVAKCLPYDQTVDAYSFGILFWQICSLTTPYAKYSTKMHAERVVRQGHRPKPDPSWPPTWVQLQQACWSGDRSFRPPFTHISRTLREQIEMMEDGVIPSRASEIRAKKKKKRVASDSLDVDTRKATDDVQKRFDTDVV